MSTQYMVWLDEQELGPVEHDVLYSLEISNKITNDTNVRAVDSSRWQTWRERKESHQVEMELGGRQPASQRSTAAHRAPATLEDVRQALRFQSAYPVFRGIAIVMLILATLGAAASGIGLFISCVSLPDVDSRQWAIVGLASSIALAFWGAITIVLLDIADASLKKAQ